jgi:hypothetical protein
MRRSTDDGKWLLFRFNTEAHAAKFGDLAREIVGPLVEPGRSS